VFLIYLHYQFTFKFNYWNVSASFNLKWEDALAQNKVYNALDACAYLGVTADDLDSLWGKCKKAGKLIKFGGGFYCGLIDGVADKDPIYVFNGFFMSMRSKFVAPGSSIHYYVVEFSSAQLSWKDFRGNVLGATDPTTAPADSIRGKILSDYAELGLTSVPNTGDNGVHASASPFEGLAERMNWLKVSVSSDPFGAKLLDRGITEETIKAWTLDPQVKGRGVFDTFEDVDCNECLDLAVEMNA
jgi:nucleoside diphosphate kinase